MEKMKRFLFLLEAVLCSALFVNGETGSSTDFVSKGIYSVEQIQHGKDKVDFDMIITIPKDAAENDEDETKRSKRAVILEEKLKWPQVVPYQFAFGQNEISSTIQQSVIEAMRHISEKTCIRFVERTNEDDYINIANTENACYSFVGRVGGSQLLNLGDGCQTVGTAVHELMHALGFLHEHNRPDRDEHVTVKYENIKADATRSFEKFKLSSYGGVSLYGIEYDRQSIMHYYNLAFNKFQNANFVESDMTIISKGPLGANEILGNELLSEKDIQRINTRYACSPNTPTPTENPNTPTPTENPNTPMPTENPNTPTPTENPNTPTPTENPNTPMPTENPNTPTPTENPNTPMPTENPNTPTPTESPNTPTPTENPNTPMPTENPNTPTPTENPNTSTPCPPNPDHRKKKNNFWKKIKNVWQKKKKNYWEKKQLKNLNKNKIWNNAKKVWQKKKNYNWRKKQTKKN